MWSRSQKTAGLMVAGAKELWWVCLRHVVSSISIWSGWWYRVWQLWAISSLLWEGDINKWWWQALWFNGQWHFTPINQMGLCWEWSHLATNSECTERMRAWMRHSGGYDRHNWWPVRVVTHLVSSVCYEHLSLKEKAPQLWWCSYTSILGKRLPLTIQHKR